MPAQTRVPRCFSAGCAAACSLWTGGRSGEQGLKSQNEHTGARHRSSRCRGRRDGESRPARTAGVADVAVHALLGAPPEAGGGGAAVDADLRGGRGGGPGALNGSEAEAGGRRTTAPTPVGRRASAPPAGPAAAERAPVVPPGLRPPGEADRPADAAAGSRGAPPLTRGSAPLLRRCEGSPFVPIAAGTTKHLPPCSKVGGPRGPAGAGSDRREA